MLSKKGAKLERVLKVQYSPSLARGISGDHSCRKEKARVHFKTFFSYTAMPCLPFSILLWYVDRTEYLLLQKQDLFPGDHSLPSTSVYTERLISQHIHAY